MATRRAGVIGLCVLGLLMSGTGAANPVDTGDVASALSRLQTAAYPASHVILHASPGSVADVQARALAEGAAIVRVIPRLDALVVRHDDPEAFAQKARGWTDVNLVEPDAVSDLAAVSAPNDPLRPDQWALQAVGLPAAWIRAKGAGVTIAVLDTGVDTDHPDLAGRLWIDAATGRAGWNAVAPGSPPEDAVPSCGGHGTHVAGIAAAGLSNGVGVAGASAANVMPIRIFQDFSGSCLTLASTTADALVWAADHGAHVISMSFGAVRAENTLEWNAVKYAAGKGVLLAASAGNGGCSYCAHYPSSYPEVVSVANLQTAAETHSSSNRGSFIEIAAPGTDILSTCVGGVYCYKTGTSMSAPLVAGILALKRSQDPSMSAAAVRDLMQRTATDLGAPGRDDTFGYGRIDAAMLLNSPAAGPSYVVRVDPTMKITEARLSPTPLWHKYPFAVTGATALVAFDLASAGPSALLGAGDEQTLQARLVDASAGREIASWLAVGGHARGTFQLPPGSYAFYVYGRAVVDVDYWFAVATVPGSTEVVTALPHARMLAGTVSQGVTPVPVVLLVEQSALGLAFGDSVDLVPDDPDVSFRKIPFVAPAGSSTVTLRFQSLPASGTERGHLLNDQFKVSLKDAAGVVRAAGLVVAPPSVGGTLTLSAAVTPGLAYSAEIVFQMGAASDIELEVAR